MPANADVIYKTKDDILAELLSSLVTAIPDANIGDDSIFRIWSEIFSNTAEGLYLAMQLLHDDMFIQTANALALIRYGDEFGRPQKVGTLATGSVTFSGAGGTYIPLGSTVSAPRPSLDDSLDFNTTQDATIPSPGIPTAPTAADSGTSGSLTGTYEYAVSFVTAAGETALGAISNAIVLTSHKANLTAIPLGGTGTTARKIYRRINGGVFGLLTTISDNTTTTYSNDNATSVGALPLTTSTAEQITVTAAASDTGTDYNVAPGTITDLSEAPAGLAGVTNTGSFTGGSDAEDFESFRTALLAFVRAPQSGAPADLVAWATSVDGVESASVFPNVDLTGASAPGTVSVRITGIGGTVPGSDIIAAVVDELDSRDLANITILVGTFTANAQAVAVTITLASGYVLADISPSVVTAITNYITSVPVGGTVYAAGVLGAVFGLAGVVNVTTTYTDTTVAATEKPTAGTITVS